MSTYLNRIEATTELLVRIQLPNNDGMSPIHALGTTVIEIDSPAEILIQERRNRSALLTLANTARCLVKMIEREEARWRQSDKKFRFRE